MAIFYKEYPEFIKGAKTSIKVLTDLGEIHGNVDGKTIINLVKIFTTSADMVLKIQNLLADLKENYHHSLERTVEATLARMHFKEIK